jgi:hypothetical protein
VKNAGVTKARILAEVRKLCLALPETSERMSHGEPAFFVRGKRSLATIWDNHHGDEPRSFGGNELSVCAERTCSGAAGGDFAEASQHAATSLARPSALPY